MARFEEAVTKTLQFEGGYSNNPLDRGGETRFGISKRWHPDVDIKNLTIERAKEIYRREYWDKLNLDLVENQRIAEEIFDTAVNTSPRKAGRFLQEALNLLEDSGLVEDGIIGEKTLAAVNNYPYPDALLKALNGFQFMHYLQTIEKDESQRIFIRGWLKRV
ncbi:MAG: secretion activating protein [Deferribacteres bacterium]|nr:secretion activating protein [Deferribacteres bacterium]